MMAPTTSALAALLASAGLLLLILAVRGPARRLVGARLAYALWLLPVLRLLVPVLPDTFVDALFKPLLPAGNAGEGVVALFRGPAGAVAAYPAPLFDPAASMLLAIIGVGAATVFAVHAMRHWRYCRRLRAGATEAGMIAGVRVIAADVEAPLAFGVLRRFIAVPRDFIREYSPGERAFALAHERAHHARGDLLANWLSLAVLAAQWWNPIAWFAIRAFRDDQEFATDAGVVAGKSPASRALYAHVLAKAAGVSALPACNLNARSNLKGRLMMIDAKPPSALRAIVGSALLALAGGAALAATASPPAAGAGEQVVTIGVKPDGTGNHGLIIAGAAVAPGAPLPGGRTLPGDFDVAGGCNLKPGAKPNAMVIKGSGGTRTYTVMCASAAPAPVVVTLAEGLASLRRMRASVATQPASAVFPEAERRHALGAIDRSIAEVEAAIAGNA
jgi:bla regulator protein blaR1